MGLLGMAEESNADRDPGGLHRAWASGQDTRSHGELDRSHPGVARTASQQATERSRWPMHRDWMQPTHRYSTPLTHRHWTQLTASWHLSQRPYFSGTGRTVP